jgi:hypothetical protein
MKSYGVNMKENPERVNDCMADCVAEDPRNIELPEVIWHYPISLFEPTYLCLPKDATFIDVVMRVDQYAKRPHIYVQQSNLDKLRTFHRDHHGRDPRNWELWEIRAYRAGMAIQRYGRTISRPVGTVTSEDGLCKSFIYARRLGPPPFVPA